MPVRRRVATLGGRTGGAGAAVPSDRGAVVQGAAAGSRIARGSRAVLIPRRRYARFHLRPRVVAQGGNLVLSERDHVREDDESRRGRRPMLAVERSCPAWIRCWLKGLTSPVNPDRYSRSSSMDDNRNSESRCREVNVSLEVCRLRFKRGRVEKSNIVGCTARGEMVVAHFDAD